MAIVFTVPSGTQTGAFPVLVNIDDGNVVASVASSDFSVVSATSGFVLHELHTTWNASTRETNVLVALVPPANQSGTAQLRVAANAFRLKGTSTDLPSTAQTSASATFDTDGTPPFGVTVISQSVETNGDFEVNFRFSEMITAVSHDILSFRDLIYDGATVSGQSITSGDWMTYRLRGTAVQTNLEQNLTISLRSRRSRSIEFTSNDEVDYTGARMPASNLQITTLTIPATGAVPRPTTSTPAIAWAIPTGTQTSAFTLSGTWSQAVTGFTAADIDLTPSGATATGFTYDTTTRMFSVTITPPTSGSGNIIVTVDERAVIPSNLEQRQSIPYAQAAPPAPTPAAPYIQWLRPGRTQYTNFTVGGVWTSSVTGFDSSKLVVSPGGISNFRQVGNSFTFTVSPPQSGSGVINITLNPSGITPAPTVTSTTVSYAQPVGTPTTPQITWDVPPGIQTGQFTVTGTWTLPILDFTSSDVEVSSGAFTSGFTYNSRSRTFSVNVTPPSIGTGSVEIFVNANQVNPANGRQAVSVSFSQPAEVTWTYPFRTQFADFPVVGRWTTPVTDFTSDDLQLSTGRLYDFQYPYQGDSQQFRFMVEIPTDGTTGAVDITLPADRVSPPNDEDEISIPYGFVSVSRFPRRPGPDERPTIIFEDERARTNFLFTPIHYLRGRQAYSISGGQRTPAPFVQDNDYRTYSTQTEFALQTFGVNERTATVIDYVFVKCSGVQSYSLSVPAGSGTGNGFSNRVIPQYTVADSITIDTFYTDSQGRVIQHDFFPLGSDRLTCTEAELTFSGTDIRIYEIMLLQGILVVTPEDLFNNIEHIKVSNTLNKTNIRGDNFTIRSLASRGKWSSRYTAFFNLRTQPPIDTMIDFIENNKNFVFVPEWNRFPSRVYLATWGTNTFPARYRSRYINGGTMLDFEVLEL